MRALRQIRAADHHSARAAGESEFRAAHRLPGAAHQSRFDPKNRRRASPISMPRGANSSSRPPWSSPSTFALNNVRMLLLSRNRRTLRSGHGRGVVGRNYAYQTMSSVASFFDEDVIVNPFMASGASGTLINDFAGDNFDHSGLGFIGGALSSAPSTPTVVRFNTIRCRRARPPGVRVGSRRWSSITTTR